MVGTLGHLVVSKLFFAAFISPFLAMMKELVAAGVPTMAFAAWSLQMVMPVSKAPWSWLVYGPRSSLSRITYHEKPAGIEVELPNAQDPVAPPPTMGDDVANTGSFVVRL